MLWDRACWAQSTAPSPWDAFPSLQEALQVGCPACSAFRGLLPRSSSPLLLLALLPLKANKRNWYQGWLQKGRNGIGASASSGQKCQMEEWDLWILAEEKECRLNTFCTARFYGRGIQRPGTTAAATACDGRVAGRQASVADGEGHCADMLVMYCRDNRVLGGTFWAQKCLNHGLVFCLLLKSDWIQERNGDDRFHQ